jgi:hypothetical protein
MKDVTIWTNLIPTEPQSFPKETGIRHSTLADQLMMRRNSAATREQNAKRLPTHGYQKISNIYFGAKLSDIWTQRKKGMPAIHK